MSWRKNRYKEINGETTTATRKSVMECGHGDREKRIDSRDVLQVEDAEVV